ncbi:hypothetical protein E1B28_004662 [Marasmius oreades]|uniref:HMG box domain-containing protein n=1 Tax=Marasmius oreades TaxID=181124 RepID=A0A9P7UZ22_9AGAR|nr:uncharacterized protein E1B28_004662 [Marasmius oreades]KAG7097299.1 hypothetical protein E1B28_004662 [Marasmius oreades]
MRLIFPRLRPFCFSLLRPPHPPRRLMPVTTMTSDFAFPHPDDQMLFGPLDMDEPAPMVWDNFDHDMKPSTFTFPVNYEYASSFHQLESPAMDSGALFSTGDESSSLFNNWIHEPESLPIPSPVGALPISIPQTNLHTSPSFFAFGEPSHFPQDHGLSPSEFAALHPLPRSTSSSFDEGGLPIYERQRTDSISSITSISPTEMSVQTPEWVSGLFDTPASSVSGRTPASSFSRSPIRKHSPLSSDHTQRVRIPNSRPSITSVHSFQSSSAPSHLQTRSASSMASRRAESVSFHDDRDATVRRRRKLSNPAPEDSQNIEKSNDSVPLKSTLRPPKLAPSAWQLYFTDWIQRQQASNTRKLNVAQAAKEAGQEYASLSAEEKEPYKRRSQAMKETREKEHAAYMRTLTPEDIKRENAFRSAQRKAGKSRKSNIKDPNAPKKPLSAYFMFLQRIRSDPRMVQEVFGDETETTKQSVLAAAKWRSMTDDERKPFLAQAEHEKMEYETARRLYEEGTTAYGTSISFSILPGSPLFPIVKVESESESEIGPPVDGFPRRTV